MKYARYISESQIAFPPSSKYIDGRLVLGYDQRADLLLADGYKPYVEEPVNPPHGTVANGFFYVDEGGMIIKKIAYVPAVPEDAQAATTAIINRIAALVIAYNAIEDVKSMETINIESLLALADAKEVSPEDMAKLKEDIVLLKTDLEGKMDANWYGIWHGWLKGAIADALQNMEEAARRARAAAESATEEAEQAEAEAQP